MTTACGQPEGISRVSPGPSTYLTAPVTLLPKKLVACTRKAEIPPFSAFSWTLGISMGLLLPHINADKLGPTKSLNTRPASHLLQVASPHPSLLNYQLTMLSHGEKIAPACKDG